MQMGLFFSTFGKFYFSMGITPVKTIFVNHESFLLKFSAILIERMDDSPSSTRNENSYIHSQCTEWLLLNSTSDFDADRTQVNWLLIVFLRKCDLFHRRLYENLSLA